MTPSGPGSPPFQSQSNADLAALLREDLRGLVDDYESAKAKAGLLDFDDLLLKTRDLLREHPEVRRELAARLRHIVVDEYQDTDPMQTEIVLLLTAEEPPDADWREAVPLPGRLCLVGDPKQSIYRFRRADVGHYLRVKARLLAHGAAEVRLTTNFRSVPAICDFVNRSLGPKFETGPGLGGLARQVDYVPLHAAREPMPGPALAAVPLAHAPYVKHLEEQEPRAVARFVGGLLDSGFAVSSADGSASRPVEPSDICLLFRRFRSYRRLVPQPYADALQDLGIPHSLAAVQTYTGSAELSFLRAALTAIEFPEDELSVYATLRGPLFAIPDQDLFLFRERHPDIRLRPARARLLQLDDDAGAASEPDRTIRDALAFLLDLHRRRTHQPIAVTLQQLLGRHRAETGFAFWNSPDQVLSNLRRLAEAARAFEARGGLSFRGFVERLATEAENPDVGSAHAIDEDVSGVRIMTTHTAKGLEFPVVVLCDGAVRRHGRASRIVNAEKGLYACDLGAGIVPWDLLDGTPAEEAEDLAELDRLLYVAMTRARDLLAAPVSEGDFPEESLLAPVAAGLKPLLERGGITPRAGASRPADGAGGGRGTGPLWDLLRADATGAAPGGGKAAEAAFLARRQQAIDAGSVPTRRAVPATVWAAVETAAEPVRIERLPREGDRPAGTAFGELVHRVLERIPLDAAEPAIEAEAVRAVRELELPDELGPAAAQAVVAALGHPLLAGARQAEEQGACYRELPLLHQEPADGLERRSPDRHRGPPGRETAPRQTLEAASTLEVESFAEPEDTTLPAGSGPTLVEGIADLVFQPDAEGAWTVLDFKTDSRPPDDPEFQASQARYRRQVGLYARAVERATGQPAKAVLLYV